MDKKNHGLKARELEVVLKISQAVSRTLDLREILKMASQMTTQALEADRCSIGLLNTKGTYEITDTSYLKKSFYPSISGRKFDLMHYPLLARKLFEKKVIHILLDRDKTTLSEEERKLFKQLNLKVFLGVPIATEGKPIGALHLGRVEASLPFSSSDIKLCQTIANQIGIAIKNATLIKELKDDHQLLEKKSEDLKTRYKQQSLVLDISRYLFRAANLQELYDVITQKTCQALGLDRCTILHFDSERKEAVIRSVYNRSRAASARATAYSSDPEKKLFLEPATEIFRSLLKKGFLLAEDIQQNPLISKARKHIKTLGVKSGLVIPIFWGRKIFGSIQLSTIKDYHRFTDSEIKLCQTIANLAFMALQNVKLMQNLQEKSITLQQQSEILGKQYREQNILLEISKAVSQTLDLQKLFDIATETTTKLLNVEHSTILFYNQAKKIATYKSAYIKGKHRQEYVNRELKVSRYPTLANLLKRNLILSESDVSESPFHPQDKKYFQKRGVKSLLAASFSLGTGMAGIFSIGSHDRHIKFSDSEVRLCKSIANLLSVAIQNAMLMQNLQEKSLTIQQQTESLKKQFREQTILLEISKALSQTLDLVKLFEIVTKRTTELLGVDRCAIMLMDEAKDASIIYKVYSNGKYQPEYEGIQRSRKDFTVLVSHLLKKPHLFCATDASRSDLSPKEKKVFEKEGIKSLLVIPFYLAGKTLGLLALSTLHRLHKFTEHEISTGQAIANQLSMTVENARLMQDLQEKNVKIQKQTEVLEKQFDEQRILLEISKALSQTLDLKKLFEIVTQKIVKLLGVDRGVVMIIDQDTGNHSLFVHHSRVKNIPELGDFPKSINEFPDMIRQLKTGQAYCISNVTKSTLSLREKRYFRKRRIKSVLAVPFILGGKILGVLALNNIGEKHEFTNSEIKLTQAIANQLSIAVENARLMQDLQEKNVKIQKQTEVLEKQFDEQRILLEISKALSQTLDMKELFKIVTQKTVELLGIDRAAAMIIDQKTGDFPLFTHFSRVKQPSELKIFPKSIRDFPYIIDQVRNGQIFCFPDISKSSLTSKEKSYFRRRGIKSVLSIPFIFRGNLLGVLGLNSIREKHEFTDPEIKLSRAIANLLSVAVENANLLEVSKKHSEELEKLSLQIINAQEEERKNIAGKLHDVLGQDLTALQLDLKMSQQELPEQLAQTRNRLKEGERLVRQALENVRNLTMDLRPPILDDFGLASAIRWYVDGFSRRTNTKVALQLQELDCKLPPEFETAIYRAIQECLTNVTKHSEASRVNISLDKKNEHLRIIIRDNGIGFNPKIFHFTNGFGLFRLKEKTELLGGKFRISSSRGKGTRVVIIFPCKDKEKK